MSDAPYWRGIISDLQAAGVTLEAIARHVGLTVRSVCYLKARGRPRYDTGARLLQLHREKCREPQEGTDAAT